MSMHVYYVYILSLDLTSERVTESEIEMGPGKQSSEPDSINWYLLTQDLID